MAIETKNFGPLEEQSVTAEKTVKDAYSGFGKAAEAISNVKVADTQSKLEKEALISFMAHGEAMAPSGIEDPNASPVADTATAYQTAGLKGIPENFYGAGGAVAIEQAEIAKLRKAGHTYSSASIIRQRALLDKLKAAGGGVFDQEINRVFANTFNSGPYADMYKARLKYYENKAIAEQGIADQKNDLVESYMKKTGTGLLAQRGVDLNDPRFMTNGQFDINKAYAAALQVDLLEKKHEEDKAAYILSEEKRVDNLKVLSSREVDKLNTLLFKHKTAVSSAVDLAEKTGDIKHIKEMQDKTAALVLQVKESYRAFADQMGGKDNPEMGEIYDADMKRLDQSLEFFKGDFVGEKIAKYDQFLDILRKSGQLSIAEEAPLFAIFAQEGNGFLNMTDIWLQAHTEGNASVLRQQNSKLIDVLKKKDLGLAAMMEYDLNNYMDYRESVSNGELPRDKDPKERLEAQTIAQSKLQGMLERAKEYQKGGSKLGVGSIEADFVTSMLTLTDNAVMDGDNDTLLTTMKILQNPQIQAWLDELGPSETTPERDAIEDGMLALSQKALQEREGIIMNLGKRVKGSLFSSGHKIEYNASTGRFEPVDKSLYSKPRFDVDVQSGPTGSGSFQIKTRERLNKVGKTLKAIDDANNVLNFGTKYKNAEKSFENVPDNIFKEMLLGPNGKKAMAEQGISFSGDSGFNDWYKENAGKPAEMSDTATQITRITKSMAEDAEKLAQQTMARRGGLYTKIPGKRGILPAAAQPEYVAQIENLSVEQLLTLRETKESQSLTEPYLDTLNNWTVGYGHLMKPEDHDLLANAKTEGEKKELIDKWKKEDMEGAKKAASEQMSELGLDPKEAKEIYLALASVNYQLGSAWNVDTPGRKGFTETWGYMVDGDWEEAAKESAASAWAAQTEPRVADFQALLLKYKMRKDSEEKEKEMNSGATE